MSVESARYSTSAVNHGILVVTVQVAELRDHQHSYGLRDEMIVQLDATKSPDLVLDIGHVQFISSIGLLAFLGIRRHLVKGRIVICNISKNVRKMFEYCRLLTVDGGANAPFEADDTPEDAVRRLKAS